MAEYANSTDFAELPENPEGDAEAQLRELSSRPKGERLGYLRRELQEEMMKNCGVVRTEDTLNDALDAVADIRERFAWVGIDDKSKVYNTELLEAVEFGFLLDLAEVTAEAAKARTESRGGHWREDHPFRDDGFWLKHSLAFRDPGGAIQLRYKPVTVTKYMPMERKY